MINIDKVEVYGWRPAIMGARNPMNSWDKSDSIFYADGNVDIGVADYKLMQNLCKAGSDHRKFMRMIVVYCDITAPLYWWKEFDTYRAGVEKNSCSTMHKIHSKEFTLDDFSHELLFDSDKQPINNETDFVPVEEDYETGYVTSWDSIEFLKNTVNALNHYRNLFVETKDKRYWEQLIQLLPSSYNQKRTVMMNYESLTNMYNARKSHKLNEWREFCKWVETLPYSELITNSAE